MPIYFSRDSDKVGAENQINVYLLYFEGLTQTKIESLILDRDAVGHPVVTIKTALSDDEMKKVYRDMHHYVKEQNPIPDDPSDKFRIDLDGNV